MILLSNISVHGSGPTNILHDLSISIPNGARVGILAAPGSGKTTLAKVMSGIQKPDKGFATMSGTVSWPLGFAAFFHPYLTIRSNLENLARLLDIDLPNYVARCLTLAKLQDKVSDRVATLSPSERAMLAYWASVILPWDILIADETITVGDTTERLKCEAIIDQHLQRAGLILLSRNTRRLEQYCDQYFVLLGGKLIECFDLEIAQEALNQSRAELQERMPA